MPVPPPPPHVTQALAKKLCPKNIYSNGKPGPHDYSNMKGTYTLGSKDRVIKTCTHCGMARVFNSET